MTTKTMEARAIISAKDNTGGVFDKIGSKLDRLAGKGKSIEGLGRSLNNIGANLNVNEFEKQAKRLDSVLRRMDHHGRQARLLEAQGSRVQRVWDGAGTAMAAVAGAATARRLATHAIKEGAQYQAEATHLKNAGRTPKDMEEIEARASEVARKVPTTTKAENLKAINETIGAFGNVHHALDNLEDFQKIAAVVKSVAGDKLSMDTGQMGYFLARFGEMRGTVQNPARFKAETEALGQAMSFMRGNFNPQELYHFGRRAGVATMRNYDQDFVTRVLPSLVTEVGGDTAGVQARAFKDLIQGRVRDQVQAKAWVDSGLVDPTKIRKGALGGQAISWQADAVKDWKLALSNPYRWMQEQGRPAMKGMGKDPDDPFQLVKFFGEMARNSSANNFFGMIGDPQQIARIEKDRQMMNATPSMQQQYQRSLTENPIFAYSAAMAQANNLLQTASSPMMQSAAQGLASLAAAIGELNAAAEKHPNFAAGGLAAGIVGAGLGTAAASAWMLRSLGLGTIGGGISGALPMMARAAVGGPFGLTMAGIGGAYGYAGEKYGYGQAQGPGSTRYSDTVRQELDARYAANMAAADAARQAQAKAQDWSLGSSGKFQQAPRTETAPGTFGQMSSAALQGALAGVKLEASVKPDQIQAQLTGSAEVKGQAQVNVTVTASSVLLDVIEKAKSTTMALAGQLRANGPGSTGRSSPDTAAPATGSGAP